MAKGRILELRGSHWRLTGFTITNGQKGVMALGTRHSVIEGLLVHTIGDEAIHLRDNSTDNVIRDNEVRDTGKRQPGFGEAIYLGQAVSNWTDGPDRSDRNRVLNNDSGRESPPSTSTSRKVRPAARSAATSSTAAARPARTPARAGSMPRATGT